MLIFNANVVTLITLSLIFTIIYYMYQSEEST